MLSPCQSLLRVLKGVMVGRGSLCGRGCFTTGSQWFQVYDEYDEEVAAAEAAEEAAIAGRTLEDKDADIKPFLPK